jgi:hypothetical protein
METDKELDEGSEGVGTSTGESSTAQTQPNRQPNWNEDPKFREWQSKMDQREADAKRLAYENAQRAQQLENQIIQMQMSGLDDEGKLAYQNQLLQKQLVDIQKQRDLDAYAMQRRRDLEDIAAKTGAPIEVFEDAPSVHHAWQKAYEYASKGKKPSREEEIQRTANDNVDIGGGRPRGKSATLQAEYDAARKSYDIRKQLEAMAKADQQGVTINEW